MMKKILVIDDEEWLREMVHMALQQKGYEVVEAPNGSAGIDLGQPDGFRECQCENCAKLFDTGKDWSEKIWLFNRRIAERLLKSHPGRSITMIHSPCRSNAR